MNTSPRTVRGKPFFYDIRRASCQTRADVADSDEQPAAVAYNGGLAATLQARFGAAFEREPSDDVVGDRARVCRIDILHVSRLKDKNSQNNWQKYQFPAGKNNFQLLFDSHGNAFPACLQADGFTLEHEDGVVERLEGHVAGWR